MPAAVTSCSVPPFELEALAAQRLAELGVWRELEK
jgi:hypothetical protein